MASGAQVPSGLDELQLSDVDMAGWCLLIGGHGSGKSHLVRRLAYQWHMNGLPHMRQLAGNQCAPLREYGSYFSRVLRFAPCARSDEPVFDFVPPVNRYPAFNSDVVLGLLAEQETVRAEQGACGHVLLILSNCLLQTHLFWQQPALKQLACRARRLNVHVILEELVPPVYMPVPVHLNLGHVFCFATHGSGSRRRLPVFFRDRYSTPVELLDALDVHTTHHACLVACPGRRTAQYRAPAAAPGPFRFGHPKYWEQTTPSAPRYPTSPCIDLFAQDAGSANIASFDVGFDISTDEEEEGEEEEEDSDSDDGSDSGVVAPNCTPEPKATRRTSAFEYPRVFHKLAIHDVPAGTHCAPAGACPVPVGSVMLVLGGEGKTHLVRGLAHRWHVQGVRSHGESAYVRFARVLCFSPRADIEYAFVPPTFRHAAFCEQAVVDLVQSQGRRPTERALVIVDGCSPVALNSAAMRRLFEGAARAGVHVVVTAPHCLTISQYVRAHVDCCFLLHTHNSAHRKHCFVQWGGHAFESLRAFDRAFDSLTDDFACMVLGAAAHDVQWYRAAARRPGLFYMGRPVHWDVNNPTHDEALQPTAADNRMYAHGGVANAAVYADDGLDNSSGSTGSCNGQCAPERSASQEWGPDPVHACEVDTRAVAIVGAARDALQVARTLVGEWLLHGSRAGGVRCRFSKVVCFGPQPGLLLGFDLAQYLGTFSERAVQALLDDQRSQCAGQTAHLRQPVLCILDGSTYEDLRSTAVRNLVLAGPCCGLHTVLVLDSQTQVPLVVCGNVTAHFCLRGDRFSHHSLAHRQWFSHAATCAECEAAFGALPDQYSCLVGTPHARKALRAWCAPPSSSLRDAPGDEGGASAHAATSYPDPDRDRAASSPNPKQPEPELTSASQTPSPTTSNFLRQMCAVM